jgi:mono/diheme cytochrome c family protein
MSRTPRFILSALAALGIGACHQTADTASSQAPAAATSAATAFAVQYGEFLARPEDLTSAAANEITKSVRLNGAAMVLGKTVYDKNCAACHGADLKGLAAQHTPDLTDAAWQFSSDDLASGGAANFPSDVEWTVRYGVRSGHPNARGAEADMVAYDPQYRNKRATGG